MKNPFRAKDKTGLILAPLGAARRLRMPSLERLPAAAAPIGVTLVGAVVLVVAMSAFLSGRAPVPAGKEPAAAAVTAPAAPAPAREAATGDLAATDDPGDETSVDGGLEAATAAAVEASPADEMTRAATAPSRPDDDASADDAAADVATQASSLIGTGGIDLTAEMPGNTDTTFIPPDNAVTSAIPPALPGAGSFAPDVPVAETDEEIAALEARQRQEVAEDLGVDPDEAATSSIGSAVTGPLRAAIATKYVNMRNGPSDEAEVLLVVPALAEIEAEEDCNWCAVTYDGKAGFIYKTFISYADGAPAPQGAATADEAAE